VIICGDAVRELRLLPDESVHCCVTSPPYYGLRDYGTAKWEGGDPECGHIKQMPVLADSTSTLGIPADGGPRRIGDNNKTVVGKLVYKDTCPKCGAHRIDSQLGLERTPEEYVAKMVEVFREVRRVLRKDGTLWLNLGDSYVGVNNTNKGGNANFGSQPARTFDQSAKNRGMNCRLKT